MRRSNTAEGAGLIVRHL